MLLTLPNILTALRIILSPFFIFFFFFPSWAGGRFAVFSIIICILIFTIIELSDLLDGIVARKYKQVTEFGKIFDPFADVFSRLTYFICFAGIHLMPVLIFAIILYREITILYCRIFMLKRGIVMEARIGGKLKACAYAGSGISGLLYVALQRLNILDWLHKPVHGIALFFFVLSAVAALLSLADYLLFMKKTVER